MRRVISWTAVILTALVLQSTVFSQVTLRGVKPELVYLVTIVLALMEGPNSGAVAGFAGGMAQDFLLNQPKGITALTLTLVGYAVGTLRHYVLTPSPLLPVIVVAAATFAGILFYGVVAFLLGRDVSGGYLFRVAILSSVYNTVLTPLAYPLLRRLAESSRSRKVLRW